VPVEKSEAHAGGTDQVLLSESGSVATITLNRPEVGNRLSKAMIERLIEICDGLRDRCDVHVVVLQAAGPHFSTGVDLADPGMLEIARQPMGVRRRQLRIGPRVVEAIQSLPQTTIVAMQGQCLGGGGCLALACDLRIAAADLSFGMPEVARGMNMSWHTVPLMVAHFGPTRAKQLLITGHRLDATEAVVWGLANRSVSESGEPVSTGEPGNLAKSAKSGESGNAGDAARAEAQSWAHEIADTVPPIAASMVKETVNAVANALTPLAHMDGDQFLLAQTTEDFREAVKSFLEKRTPSYRNR